LWTVLRGVTGPLSRLTVSVGAVAEGRTDAAVSDTERRDEIGALGGAMRTFKDSMIEADRLRGEQKALELRSASERK
ncbi:HAMP domain-containing protein, partial [Acinetobacter baumannii]|uniref:HAMP domain-containing protein n=1 Tax=Acinetobacter baumannii TaxID=470 RepID=UPI0013D48CF9